MVKKFTSDDFKNGVLRHDGLVLVDFYADWCGPCKMLAPILEEISDDLDDVVIAKVNVDENSDVAADFKIVSIPTMCIFKDGDTKARLVGWHSNEQIIETINGYR